MPRPMILAQNGWYSSNKETCKKEIEKHIDWDLYLEGKTPISAVVPHAGWYFCGKLSINCIRILKEKNGDIKNVFIFGGHLSEANLAILETFDYAHTPFGDLKNNLDIMNFLKREHQVQAVDYLADNTIEILFPIIYYYFGNAVTITALYLPPNDRVNDLLKKIYKYFGKNSVFIGSTDLTHYGPNYGFIHHDKSMDPVDWVKNVNDKKYLDMLLEMKGEESLAYALKHKSACSSGAAYGALTIAKEAGRDQGNLIGYHTSYDIHKDSSFVGYTGILY